MNPNQAVFDQVVAALGLDSGAELARALGRKKQAASHWRKHGFPKSRCIDLLHLARERRRDLPREFLIAAGIDPEPPRSEAA